MKETPVRLRSGIPYLIGVTRPRVRRVAVASGRLRAGQERDVAGPADRRDPARPDRADQPVRPVHGATQPGGGAEPVRHVGTFKDEGLRWNNPFYSKKISLRVRNFESGKLKVNDPIASPIEIAAVIVWQVVDASDPHGESSCSAHPVRGKGTQGERLVATTTAFRACPPAMP